MVSENSAYVQINTAQVLQTLANSSVSRALDRMMDNALQIAIATAPIGEYIGKRDKVSPTGEARIRDSLHVKKVPRGAEVVYFLGANLRHLAYVVNRTPPHVIRARNIGPSRTIPTSRLRAGVGGRTRVGAGTNKGAGQLEFFWAKKGGMFRGPEVNHPGTPGNPFLYLAIEQALRQATGGGGGGGGGGVI